MHSLLYFTQVHEHFLESIILYHKACAGIENDYVHYYKYIYTCIHDYLITRQSAGKYGEIRIVLAGYQYFPIV